MKIWFLVIGFCLSTSGLSMELDGSIAAAEKRLSYLEGSLKIAQTLQLDTNSLTNLNTETEKLSGQIAALKTKIARYKANRSAIAKRRYITHLSIIQSTVAKLDQLTVALTNLRDHGGGSVVHYEGATFEEDLGTAARIAEEISALQAGRSKCQAFPEDLETSTQFVADVTAACESEKTQAANAREVLAGLKFDRIQYLIAQDTFNMSATQVARDHVLSTYSRLEAILAVSDFLAAKQ